MSSTKKVESWHSIALDLKQYANSQGMSQVKLAKVSGASLRSISRLFTLTECASFRNILKIADALNVSVKVLK